MKATRPAVMAGTVVVGTVVGFLVPLASEHEQGAQNLGPTLAAAALWLIVTGALVLAGGLVFLAYYRRRHIREMRLRDATAEPIALRPSEQAWDAELAWLGFRRVGVLEVTGPLDRAEKWLHYANQDGRIAAQISRRRGYVCFGTTFADAASLTTRNKGGIPTLELPFYRAVNVPAPDGSLSLAYQAHLMDLASLAAAHGEAVSINTMTEVIANEERSRDVLVPEILKRARGWHHRLAEAALLVVLAGAWLMAGLQLLSLV